MSPKLENGYTKIANEILDALMSYRIPGEQIQCLFVILRNTYGWDRKSVELSMADFSKLTGIKRSNVCRAIKELKDKNVISVIKTDNSKVSTYCFNKKYKQWKVLSKTITVIKTDNRSVIKTDNKVLSKMITATPLIHYIKESKETSKESIEKKKKSSEFIPPQIEDVIKFFIEKGFPEQLARKAFEYYSVADWKDSRGQPVKNWKQKMISVWMKEENRQTREIGMPAKTARNIETLNRFLERHENE